MRRAPQRHVITVGAKGWKHLGRPLYYTLIIWHTIKAGRLLELILTTLPIVMLKLRKESPIASKTDTLHFVEAFRAYSTSSEPVLIARANSICEVGDTTVIGEYGQPGSRIRTVSRDGETMTFTPYASDPGVWHIHAVQHLKDNLYLAATGDRKKYLDVLEINRNSCTIKSRLRHHLGGFTALLMHNEKTWAGTDFAERPNYLTEVFTGDRYYLPKICSGSYIVHLSTAGPTTMLVIARRLSTFTGHALLFCTQQRKFVAANAITISEQTDLEWPV